MQLAFQIFVFLFKLFHFFLIDHILLKLGHNFNCWHIYIPSTQNFCCPKAQSNLDNLQQRASIFWLCIQIIGEKLLWHFSVLEPFTSSHKELLLVTEQILQHHKSKIKAYGHPKIFWETHQAWCFQEKASCKIEEKKKKRKKRLELLNRGQFFLNKLNANTLIAIVNTDPKTRAGFRGIWRKPETDRQYIYK